MASTPVTNGHKSKKQSSKVITLRLPSSVLDQFLPKKEPSSPSSASSPKSAPDEETPSLKPAPTQDILSESNSILAPAQDASSQNTNGKKKGGGPSKRGLNALTDNLLKPRGKPGPKKKPRLEDGTIDHNTKAAPVGGTANPKLGPKANTGNINANLRALDRSGKPCRKWARKGLQLKSFTGVVWELSTWKGGDRPGLLNGSEGSMNDISMQDSSDMKPSESDTVQGSNAGDNADRMDISTPAASSPAPMQVAPVIAAQS